LYHFDGAVLPDFANLLNQIDGAYLWATDAGFVYHQKKKRVQKLFAVSTLE
jgi:hypothetical protein